MSGFEPQTSAVEVNTLPPKPRSLLNLFFFKNGPNPASFCLFSFFSHDKYSTNTINDKSIDGVLGTRTRGGRMAGANESTELWQHPNTAKSF